MSLNFKSLKIGDQVHVKSFDRKGTVIDIKDGYAYAIDEKNIVTRFTDKDNFEIIKKISFIARIIIDILVFFTKRPKLKL